MLSCIMESALLWFLNGDSWFRTGCPPFDYWIGFVNILFRWNLLADIGLNTYKLAGSFI